MTSSTSEAPAGALLPRPPGVIRRWLAAHPRVVDGIIVGGYLFGCALVVAVDLVAGIVADTLPDVDPEAAAIIGARSGYLSLPWAIVSALIVVAVAVALAYRRRFPVHGVVLVSILLFLEQGLLAAPNSVALVFLLYAAPVHRGVRAGWVAFAWAAASSALLLLLTRATGTGVIGPSGVMLGTGPIGAADQIIVMIANTLWLLAVLLIGINLGNRRRYVDALIDRAQALAREQEERARLAAAEERARIAREMHDIVAHSLSVVVTLSEAAAVAIDTQPEAAKQALERSVETGRTALTEMRRLLGVLGDEAREDVAPSSLAPQPSIAQLAELTAGFAEAGLRVSLTEQGVPRGDRTQQLAVYRIVQEALTNALRHAGPGAEARVELTHEFDRTLIAVTDTGPVAPHAHEPERLPGSGRGLDGARQRARVFDGRLEAGPHGAGWRLLADVPIPRPRQEES